MKEQRGNTDRPAEVIFLSAPYVFPPRQSLALSIFKACLAAEGMTSTVLYPMFRMIRHMGAELCRSLNDVRSMTLYEEYIFAHLTGIGEIPGVDEYAASAAGRDRFLDPDRFAGLIRRAIEAAEACTEETAREIAAARPAVVAASTLFTQTNATLAILRRVKELAPEIRTLAGGPNCAGRAGAAMLRWYPQVDAVFFGEGDEGIAQACRALADGNPDALPYGVVCRGMPLPDPLPYAMTRDMNRVPVPDFSDFIRQLAQAMTPELRELLRGPFYSSKLEPILQVEGSRGCWWGEKHPCRFCALNGERNVYRAKTPQRLLSEIRELSGQVGTRLFEMTDNVISRDTIRELPGLLEAEPKPFSLVAEVKTHLKVSELEALHRGGFVAVQGGIESLQDHLLQLMGKGASAVQNVAFMKSCFQSGIDLMWNILYGIPGETAADYEELLELLPKLAHLQPPQLATRITFQRYSAYVRDPDQYGLELQPNAFYSFLFGNHPELIADSALYYDLTGGETLENFEAHRPLYTKLWNTVQEWQQSWKEHRPARFTMLDRGDYIMMMDTRPCRQSSVSFLRGAEAELCRICSRPVFQDRIMEQLGGSWTEERIRQALERLTERNYLIFLSGKYLLLATPGRDDEETETGCPAN